MQYIKEIHHPQPCILQSKMANVTMSQWQLFHQFNQFTFKLELITTRDSSGATPLHLAAQEGHLEATEMLVEYGAKKCLHMTSGRDYQTPADLAKSMKHHNVARFLQNVGKGEVSSGIWSIICQV